MATWRIIRHVKRDPNSVEYVGPTLTNKPEANRAMREIAARTPLDPLDRPYLYRLSKLG